MRIVLPDYKKNNLQRRIIQGVQKSTLRLYPFLFCDNFRKYAPKQFFKL